MLSITDARFQDDVLNQAKRAGKISPDYEIPAAYKRNTPAHIKSILAPMKAAGHLSAFPFGTDFTDTEQALMPALSALKMASASKVRLLSLLLRSLRADPKSHAQSLKRLGLEAPNSMRARLEQRLILGALAARGSRL